MTGRVAGRGPLTFGIVSYRGGRRLATPHAGGFGDGCYDWWTSPDTSSEPRGTLHDGPHQRLRRRDLEGPGRAARRPRAARDPPHRVPLDPRHERPRPEQCPARG